MAFQIIQRVAGAQVKSASCLQFTIRGAASKAVIFQFFSQIFFFIVG